MTDAIISPLALWEDFRPSEGEFHISPVREFDDGFTVRRGMYYDGYRKGKTVVRAYCEFVYTHAAYDEQNGYLPVVILCADLYSPETKDCVWQLTDAGYAVLGIDYLGDESSPHATFYPDDLAFAKYENAKEKLYLVETSAKNTAWYVWTAMTWRAIYLLDELDEADVSRLGLVGVQEGANLVACLTALEDRVRAAALVGNTGWQDYGLLYDPDRANQIGFFDDQSAGYKYSLSVESYAQFIKKPTLLICATNDTANDFDRAFDTYSRFPDNLKSGLSVSPRADGAIRYSQLGNLRAWLDYNIRYVGYYPDMPETEAYVSAGRQYVRLVAAQPEQVRSAELYYAYNEEDFRIRNWFDTVPEEMGEGRYLAPLATTDEDRYLFCFAVVTYENGVSCASRQIAVKLNERNGVPMTPSRLIYDATQGTDCFTAVETGGLFDYRDELRLCEGPLGIRGIEAVVGNLATYKISDARYSGYEGDLLTVNYYAPESFDLVFRIGTFERGAWSEYECDFCAQGGEIWNKTTLSLTDFKNGGGLSPASWEDIHRLVVVRPREKKFLISTLIWT